MKLKKTISIIFGAIALLDVAAFADSSVPKDYPLTKCPVSGEAYGSGGMVPYKTTHDGTEVWLCCKSCQGKFSKDAAKYAQIVKDAAARK